VLNHCAEASNTGYLTVTYWLKWLFDVELTLSMNLKNNCELRGLGLFHGTVKVFAWTGWRKSRKISFEVFGVPAEIRTEHLPNTSHKHCQPIVYLNAWN
jgi:hypothetical protein